MCEPGQLNINVFFANNILVWFFTFQTLPYSMTVLRSVLTQNQLVLGVRRVVMKNEDISAKHIKVSSAQTLNVCIHILDINMINRCQCRS